MSLRSVLLEGARVVPGKIVCIGRNYVDHIHELGNEVPDEMVVFIKPNSAISGELYAVHQEPLHYETEICFLVKNKGLAAVGIGLDLTKRALQSRLKERALPWERAKAFDGSAVFSDFVAIDELPGALRIELDINGAPAQRGEMAQMIHLPQQILRECQTFLTLDDNDILMTGTPKGVGQVQPGDQFTARLYLDDELLIEANWLAK